MRKRTPARIDAERRREMNHPERKAGIVTVRLKPAERAAIEAKALACGVSLAEYARQAIREKAEGS